MGKLLLAIGCLLSAWTWAAEQDIDFKGTAFGASEQEFSAKHSRYRCSDSAEKFRVASDRSCLMLGKPKESFEGPKDRDGTFAGVPADIVVNFYNDRLSGITVYLHASSFMGVFKALRERYGTPDSFGTPITKNRMGSEFENVVATWKKGDVTLKAEKYGPDLNTSSITYRTDWAIQEFKKRRGQDTKKAAGDI